MQTPDVTKAQILALLAPVFAFFAAFGIFDLTDAQQIAIVGLVGTLSTVLTLADALIRRGRAKVVAAEVIASPGVSAAAAQDVGRSRKDGEGGKKRGVSA